MSVTHQIPCRWSELPVVGSYGGVPPPRSCSAACQLPVPEDPACAQVVTQLMNCGAKLEGTKMELGTEDAKKAVMPTSTRACEAGAPCLVDELVGAIVCFGGLGLQRHNDLFLLTFHWSAADGMLYGWWTRLDGELMAKGPSGKRTTTSVVVPERRSKASLVYHSATKSCVLFGGWRCGKGDAGKLNDTWAVCLVDLRWRCLHDGTGSSVPPPRSAHAAAMIDEQTMLVYGGIGRNKFGDLYAFNVAKRQWKRLQQVDAGVPRSSYGQLLSLSDGVVALFGGLTCGQLNDVRVLDVGTGTWTTMECECSGGSSGRSSTKASSVPFKRGRHSTVLLHRGGGNSTHGSSSSSHDEESPVIAVFGGTNLRQKDNGLYFFDVAARRWSKPRVVGPKPAPMEGHVMFTVRHIDADGRRMQWCLVFAGWLADGWSSAIHIIDAEPMLQVPNGSNATTTISGSTTGVEESGGGTEAGQGQLGAGGTTESTLVLSEEELDDDDDTISEVTPQDRRMSDVADDAEEFLF